MLPRIGESAGRIWNTLLGRGHTAVNILKKETGLDDRMLHLALGWLAREGKVEFEQNGKNTLVWLLDG